MSNKAKRAIKAGFHIYKESYLDTWYVILEHLNEKCVCGNGIFDYDHTNFAGGRNFVIMKCNHCGKTEQYVVDEAEIDKKSRLVKMKPQWESDFINDLLVYENKRIADWLNYFFEQAKKDENGDFVVPGYMYDEFKKRSQTAFVTEFTDEELFNRIKAMIVAMVENEESLSIS